MTFTGGLAAVATAAAVSATAIALLARFREQLPQAVPNDRSLHARAVPRVGGYGIWLGFAPIALLFPPAIPGGVFAWAVPWLALIAISALDDARGVRVVSRLSVHIIAAAWCAASLVAAAGGDARFQIVVVSAMLALAIAWATNLYNFMDGSDGLAATMTIFGFCVYGVAAAWRGTSSIAYFALATATIPFLVVNRPRATMFLGDIGAVPLGFLAAAFGIGGVLAGDWPAWFPLLVFLPFIADATVTLVRRAVHGERLAKAHKDHHYQRLHQLGAGHLGTLVAYACAMAGTSVTALACLMFAPGWGFAALLSWCVLSFVLFAAIDYHWRRKPSASR